MPGKTAIVVTWVRTCQEFKS